MIKPAGYVEGQRYPVLSFTYSGPHAPSVRDRWFDLKGYYHQMLAQEGYLIWICDNRSASGKGLESAKGIYKSLGPLELQDLEDGIDWLVAEGYADPERVALWGWSYGGYMTSFAVTRTSRFRAASMGAGLPNLVSMVHSTDIPDYLAAHMGGELWEDYSAYERHSAIHHIKNVTTPTQVIHGARDLRVPFTQGQEFYVALGRLGVETEMIVYPRTPHGPREPKLLMDVTPRILDWFARHGGPEPPEEETSSESAESQATGSE
jgi:dipeptidyl aminopeptidase/acylaminoacyl peptidase